MKIVYPGYGQFFFELYPLWKRLLGSMLLFLCVVTIASTFVGQLSISCSEKMNNIAKSCVLHHRIFNIYHSRTPLGQLYSAQVKMYFSNKNPLYNVILKTNQQDINLTEIRSAMHSKSQLTADAINKYIQSSTEKTFEVPFFISALDYLLIMFGIIFFLLGFYTLFLTRNITIHFNKKISNNITVKNYNAFSKNVTEIPIAKGDKILLQEKIYNDGPLAKLFYSFLFAQDTSAKNSPGIPPPGDFVKAKSERIGYRLAIIQTTGESLPLTDYLGCGFGELNKIANQMNNIISSRYP